MICRISAVFNGRCAALGNCPELDIGPFSQSQDHCATFIRTCDGGVHYMNHVGYRDEILAVTGDQPGTEVPADRALAHM